MDPSSEEISATLAHYDLGDLVSEHKGHQGFANLNLRIETTRGCFLYRVNLQQCQESMEYEHQLLHYLDEQEIPVALPLPRTDGVKITPSPSGPVVIYSFIEGHMPDINETTVREIARVAARMNTLPVPDHLHRDNPLTFAATEEIVRVSPIDDALRKRVQQELNRLRDPLSIPLPDGIVHGDLFHDNTLYRGNQLAAVIDFEDASTEHRMVEIGVTINGFCAPENILEPDLVNAFLESYESIAPLNEEEQRLLPAYIHWGTLVMICWHLKDPTPHKLERVAWHFERLEQAKRLYPLTSNS